jgi:hypothetical protein
MAGQGASLICLKRILKKLENKNSFKKKRDVLKTTQKHLRRQKRIFRHPLIAIVITK